MIFYFLILIFFFLFNFNLFFFNEEFIIFISMIATFYFCLVSAMNFANMYLFLRVEFLYFFFLYLIVLVTNLIKKLFSLVYLKLLNLRSYVLLDLFALFIDSISRFNIIRSSLNSVLIGNFFNFIFSNILVDNLYINSNNILFKRVSFFYHILNNSSVKDIFVNSFFFNLRAYFNFIARLDFSHDVTYLDF